jgi:hypothetical protein
MTVSHRDLRASIARLVGSALGAFLIGTFVGCGGGGGGDSTSASSASVASISTQPLDQHVIEGSAASFSVVAVGSAPLGFQWQSSSDGTTFATIAGATSSTYATAPTALAQSGLSYRVVVSNSAGSVTSSTARLTVTPNNIAPSISVQPAAQSVTAPSTATFNVTATGTTLAYGWQLSTDAGASFTPIVGGPNAPTLAVANTATSMNGYLYRVRVSNGVGSLISDAALLSVAPTPVAPAFTLQPAVQSVIAGQGASFTVASSGTPAPVIQWRLNGGSLANGTLASGLCSGATVSGATTTTLTLTTLPLSCNGAVFSAVASNGVAPNATSTGATLTVNAAPMPPMITAHPASQTVLTGATPTFSVSANGAGLTYQWKKNGTTIVGATAATYTTPAVSWVDSGALYTVVVSNADGNATSNAAQLNLMLSANQQAFESLIVAPSSGSYVFTWNLNYMGAEVNGVNYAWSEFAVASLSPLTHGPQTDVESAPLNLTATLAIELGSAQRVLKNGQVLVVPIALLASKASYVGSDVRVDYLAADNTTVAWSQIRTDYSTVSLSGVLAGSTDDFAHFHNSFFSNPAILKPLATYQAGAAYVKYTAYNKDDRYNAFDCGGATTDANITPCSTGTTLTAALTTGITSPSDGVTYTLADGAMRTVAGVPIWVATAPRPVSAVLSTVPQYRIYFQLNGNVYTGALIPDGSVFATSYYVSNPGGTTVTDRLTFLPFQIRMNKAARDSVAAAMNL